MSGALSEARERWGSAYVATSEREGSARRAEAPGFATKLAELIALTQRSIERIADMAKRVPGPLAAKLSAAHGPAEAEGLMLTRVEAGRRRTPGSLG